MTTARELASAVEEALRRWDEAAPHIDGATTMATIHGCPYRGPNVGEAMDALRDALTRSRTITKEQVEAAAKVLGDDFMSAADRAHGYPMEAALTAAKAFGLVVEE